MVPGIRDCRDYRLKVEHDLAAFLADESNPYLAINAWTFAYHLHEWIWAHTLKPMKPPMVRGEVIRDRGAFSAWLDRNCPNFSLVQDLTNGSKHSQPVTNGETVAGFGRGPYGVGPYGASYLLIDLGEEAGDDRYSSAGEVVEEMASFMIALSKELGG